VAVGISTSGTSPNIIAALRQARAQKVKTIGLAGRDGGLIRECADIPIIVASKNTARIQECHIAIGHILCELTENELFSREQGGKRVNW
jgi:D-sedoheptulose 7-phosphate isomerase